MRIEMPIVYFPDTGKPCPPVLTEAEAVRLLRLDTLDVRFASQTLRRYRDAGQLKACRISKGVFYPLVELIRFIENQTEGNL